MEAFHSFWSKPNRLRNQGEIYFQDHELQVMILSALKWREINGTIQMITDTEGADYFRENGFDCIWDGMDTALDEMDSRIDPFLFWAAGKLYALKRMRCPCVMLDTDLIIWKNLEDFFDRDVVGAHYEELYDSVYPDVEGFAMKEAYVFPKEWDYHAKALNTAFLYLKDSAFRDYYVGNAEWFMKNIRDGFNPITAMCFAEQRIIMMCAVEKKLKVDTLLNLEYAGEQELVTHVWGQKAVFRQNPEEEHRFCARCVQRLVKDFPDYADRLLQHERFSDYRHIV